MRDIVERRDAKPSGGRRKERNETAGDLFNSGNRLLVSIHVLSNTQTDAVAFERVIFESW